MSEVAAWISGALDEHKVAHVRDGERITLTESGVGFQIAVHDREVSSGTDVMIQLDIGTTAPALGARIVWESFAGIGADRRSAQGEAFGKFLVCPFHVILSALAGHRCEADGTEWETWQGVSGNWRVCDSALLVQGADPAEIPYDDLFPRLREEFRQSAGPGVHWVSMFFCFLNGEIAAHDVRLDGEPWTAGEAVLKAWTFAPPEPYVSGRYTFIALPDGPR